MAISYQDYKFTDMVAQATRVTSVDAAGNPSGGSLVPVVRTTNVVRYASAGPAGVTVPGTRNIPAGRQAYSVAVLTAASAATPTLDGVALPAGTTISLDTRGGDTLEAAVLVTVAGDDVIFTEVF